MINYDSLENNSHYIILECQICFEEFDMDSRKPVVLDCGHSVCQKCLSQIIAQPRNRKCPFDNKELKRSFDQYPFNWSYIDIISSISFIFIVDYKKSNKPLKEHKNYKELRNEEGLYKGQVQDKNSVTRHGYGVMEYHDCSVYTGQWKNNKR